MQRKHKGQWLDIPGKIKRNSWILTQNLQGIFRKPSLGTTWIYLTSANLQPPGLSAGNRHFCRPKKTNNPQNPIVFFADEWHFAEWILHFSFLPISPLLSVLPPPGFPWGGKAQGGQPAGSSKPHEVLRLQDLGSYAQSDGWHSGGDDGEEKVLDGDLEGEISLVLFSSVFFGGDFGWLYRYTSLA